MNTIIYHKDIKSGITQFDNVVSTLSENDILEIWKTKEQCSCTLKNGDTTYTVLINDMARGHRWNYAYIPMSASNEELDCLVFPKFINTYYINGTWSEYYTEAELKENKYFEFY